MVRRKGKSGSHRRVGDWESSTSYHKLFGSEEYEGAMPVELKPIIAAVRQALRPGNKTGRAGWFASKCSETNELVVHLMRSIGYVGNFHLERLPLNFHKMSDHQLVLQLDSRLLIRCIKSSSEGCQALSNWIARFGEEMERILLAETKRARKDDPHLGATESRSLYLIQLLNDPEGLAAAAIEAFRGDQNGEGNSASRVFFALDRAAQVIWPTEVMTGVGTEIRWEGLSAWKKDKIESTVAPRAVDCPADHHNAGVVVAQAGNTGTDNKNLYFWRMDDEADNRAIRCIWKILSDPRSDIKRVAEYCVKVCDQAEDRTQLLARYFNALNARLTNETPSATTPDTRKRFRQLGDLLRRRDYLR
jgi:hypothetical protein